MDTAKFNDTFLSKNIIGVVLFDSPFEARTFRTCEP